MKKHLIAAAVAAAVAAPAMAQVSLDGYWEGNYGSIKKSGGAATTKTTSMNGLSDVFGGSEINFRGTEDLGGGLKAGFRLTKEFSEATGAGVNASEWTNAFLTVETGMGSIAAGRFISGARDLGGVYRFNGDFGRVNAFVNSAGNRPAQQLQYTSPAFMGFNLVLGSAKAETDGLDSATSESLAMIRYVAGPLRVAASSNKIKGRPADTGSATAVGRASNANQKETAVGGSYDFGVAKLGLAYFKDDLAAANGVSAQKSDGKATTVQLEAPLSGGVTLMAGYNKYQSDIAQADGSGIAVGVKYALSKRTNLFAVHNKDKNEANANWNFRAYGSDIGGDLANGEDLSRTVFGINHSF
jgi:predicted porin